MVVYFGLELDNLAYPTIIDRVATKSVMGYHYRGPQGFLYLLEQHLGLGGLPNNIDFLRIEQFRQAIQKHIVSQPHAFYANSFDADQLATANELLQRRDELLLAGWNFSTSSNTPIRLKTISQIDAIAQASEEGFTKGYADRFMDVLEKVEEGYCPIQKIYLNEPFDLLPTHLQRLFNVLQAKGIVFETLSAELPQASTDLGRFQSYLKDKKREETLELKADGSLLIIKAKRETTAAAYLARTFQQNPLFRPLCLIPEKNRALDNAFFQEGLPSLGIHSESLARPLLQILKLVTSFLWDPIDPYKIMEFLALPIKPLPEAEVELSKEGADEGKKVVTLSNILSKSIAQSPGLGNVQLEARVKEYFRVLKETEKPKVYREAKQQYEFWFKRRRYDMLKTVPKADVIQVFRYLANWASKYYENGGNSQNSLLVLSEQSKRAVELLEALPVEENELTHLQTERVVRTIYEPSPIVFKERENEHLPYIHHSSALIGEIDSLLWWNFIDSETEAFFSKWYKKELSYLGEKGIILQSPEEQNKLLLWQRTRPFLYTKETAILVIPTAVNGSEKQVHPLYGDLDALFDDLDKITVDLDTSTNYELLSKYLNITLPYKILLKNRILGRSTPYLNVTKSDLLKKREEETYSSLDTLFFYPYKWVFQYQIGLRKSSILSIVKDNTLLGNLAHRLLELLTKNKNVLEWDRGQITTWIEQKTKQLLEREGAVLLMYGREPEKVAFVNKLKFAANNLISMIRENGWRIKATEQSLERKFLGIDVKGKADLVLENEDGELAVIDLKWRGARRRENVIRSEEDLQLVLYSKLLTNDEEWAHTAYYIIENGKMIARNNLAFKEAIAVTPEENHKEVNLRIWQKMQATYQWRTKQLKEGKIEVRTEMTVPDLEDTLDAAELVNLLEMKSKDAPFDDFKVLINSIS